MDNNNTDNDNNVNNNVNNVDNNNDSHDHVEENLSSEEMKKINNIVRRKEFFATFKNAQNFLAASLLLSKQPAPFSIGRRLGFDRKINVYNISGKKAWVIISPVPIKTISSIGIEKIGNVSFEKEGDYHYQQSSIANNDYMEFELDNSQIYYSVFFDCNGKWKTPFKYRRINAKIYDINLLEKHVNNAIDYESLPIN